MTGAAKNTVVRLLADIGCACADYHNRYVRDLKVRRLQCDEIWQFVGSKAKNVSIEKKQEGWGDIWTWIGIDADTKLVVRTSSAGAIADGRWTSCRIAPDRIRGRVQVTTDGHGSYLDAVEDAFGLDMDYAQLQKIYGAADGRRDGATLRPVHRLRHESCERQSRPQARKHVVCGAPEPNACG